MPINYLDAERLEKISTKFGWLIFRLKRLLLVK